MLESLFGIESIAVCLVLVCDRGVFNPALGRVRGIVIMRSFHEALDVVYMRRWALPGFRCLNARYDSKKILIINLHDINQVGYGFGFLHKFFKSYEARCATD